MSLRKPRVRTELFSHAHYRQKFLFTVLTGATLRETGLKSPRCCGRPSASPAELYRIGLFPGLVAYILHNRHPPFQCTFNRSSSSALSLSPTKRSSIFTKA